MIRTSILTVLLLSLLNVSTALPAKSLSRAKVQSGKFCPNFCFNRMLANLLCNSLPHCSVKSCTGFIGPGFQCASASSSGGGGGGPPRLPKPDGSCKYSFNFKKASLSATCTCPSSPSSTAISYSYTDPVRRAKAVAYAACVNKFLRNNCTPAFWAALSVAKRKCCSKGKGTSFFFGGCAF